MENRQTLRGDPHVQNLGLDKFMSMMQCPLQEGEAPCACLWLAGSAGILGISFLYSR